MSAALDPAWRRWTLLLASVALGILYIAAFAIFRRDSRDFVIVEREAFARAAASAHRFSLPTHFEFSRGEEGASLLGAGWRWPDAEGTFLAHSPATAHLRIDARGKSVRVRLRYDAMGPADEVAVHLAVNGRPVADWPVVDSGPQSEATIRLPADLAGAGSLDFEFTIDAKRRMRRWSDDVPGRDLHLRLRQLWLDAQN